MLVGSRIIAEFDSRAQSRARRAALFADEEFVSDFGVLDPIVVRHEHNDDFGTVGSEPTIAEVQDLMNNWDARMADLNSAVNAASSQWQASDPAGWADFNLDMGRLTARYGNATSVAKGAISDTSWNPLPTSLIPDQTAYDGIMKAIRQCYPPDGCAIQKGDFDDLYNRLTAARAKFGQPPPTISTVQPVAQDIDQQVFAATAPADVLAQITGQEKPQGPLSPTTSFLKWFYDHKNAILIGAVVVVVGAVAYQFWTLISLPAKVASGALKVAALPALPAAAV